MLDLLKKCALFEGCTADELAKLVRIGQAVPVSEGEKVFAAGDAAENFFVVSRGRVELMFEVVHYNVPKAITLETKSPGEIFGWSAMVGSRRYTLSAVASGEGELIRFDAEEVRRLCRSNRNMGYTMMKNLAEVIGERFVSMQRLLIDILREELREREK